MARKPHDLTEWLQFLWLSKDTRLAEFAVELQDMRDDDCTELYWDLRDGLEKLAERKFMMLDDDNHVLEFFEGKLGRLDEIHEKRLERAKRVVALLPKPLEYDL